MFVVEFEPPAPMLNANDRVHPLRRAAITREWRAAAMYATVAACGPVGRSARRLPDGRYRVIVKLPVKGRRRRDPFNWAPTVKAIVDGLTDAGLWDDDDESRVTVAEPVLSVGSRMVRVIVERLEHGEMKRG